MPNSALALVLAAALLHALWNLAAKHAGGSHRLVLLVALMIGVLAVNAGVFLAAGGPRVLRTLRRGVVALAM